MLQLLDVRHNDYAATVVREHVVADFAHCRHRFLNILNAAMQQVFESCFTTASTLSFIFNCHDDRSTNTNSDILASHCHVCV